MSIDEIKAMKAQYEATIKAEGKTLLADEFKTFFEVNPGIQAVRWRQYTPYFNDGDPCRFGVRDFYYSSGEESGGDYDDGFLSPWDFPECVEEAMRDFGNRVSNEDVLLAVFGDHVMVTATREGFEVEEYSHD